MSEPAIELRGVGKMYKIFTSRTANLKEALGLPSKRGQRYSEFWALRDVDLELGQGERIGVIGRNGAGKTTLLKLITQNVVPTEGSVTVRGDVRALMDTGGGLHPEFTGQENISAALTFLGLSSAELRRAREDIADFTELGRFLDQPFKTYSLGMQARLAFAIATTIRPEILIIDEVLGAGDAYFFAKSAARMKELLTGGAAVLLVTHALDQVTRFCDQTVWLDRGRIVMRGPTLQVVKSYEVFIRQLDERRLQAKNQKARLAVFDGFERDSYTAHVVVQAFAPNSSVDVTEIVLRRDGEIEETIDIGNAQDANTTQAGYVVLEGHNWSTPRPSEDGYYRSVERFRERPAGIGAAVFYLWFLYPTSTYSVELTYRSLDPDAYVTVSAAGLTDISTPLPVSTTWRTIRLVLERTALERTPEQPDGEADARREVTESRWEGLGGLSIEDVRLLNHEEAERAVVEVGKPMSIVVEIESQRSEAFPLVMAALIFRLDGIVVTRHVSEPTTIHAVEGDRWTARLDLGPLQLGNGSYVVSVGLYRTLDLDDIEPSEFYDYFDRSFDFQVAGNPALHNELVRHPGTWKIESSAAAVVDAVALKSDVARR